MKNQREKGIQRARNLSTSPSIQGPSGLQGLIGVILVAFATFCAISLVISKTYTPDGTLWTGIKISVAVGTACSFVPGLILSMAFEQGRAPFVSIVDAFMYGDCLERFCYVVLAIWAIAIAIWIGHSYLTISFTKVELTISLLIGAVTGATAVPFALWHIPRKKLANT